MSTGCERTVILHVVVLSTGYLSMPWIVFLTKTIIPSVVNLSLPQMMSQFGSKNLVFNVSSLMKLIHSYSCKLAYEGFGAIFDKFIDSSHLAKGFIGV